MTELQVINTLLVKETEVTNHMHNAIREIIRLGYETERGKEQVTRMIESIRYTLDDIERLL